MSRPTHDRIKQALRDAFPLHYNETSKGKVAIKVNGDNVAGVLPGAHKVLIGPNIANSDPRIEPATGAKHSKKQIWINSEEDLSFAIEVIRELL